MLGVLAIDAKHTQAIIANEHDVHIRGAIVPTTIGILDKDGKLHVKIDFVVRGAIPRERMLRAYPVEEIGCKH